MKNGILVVDKPEGISSARVVARVKKLLGVKKIGHTGTLDPFATGVLLCAVNKGTRISRFFLGGNKRYTARVCLGAATDTYDRTGKVTRTTPLDVMGRLSEDEIQAAVLSFAGVQKQVPPVYSALKHEGQPLYKLARKGQAVQKPPRTIQIFSISIRSIEMPYIDIDVACSSGTYIRSIAYDLGEKLGCGAHLAELCRTESGKFTLTSAIGLEALETMGRARTEDKIIPLSQCLEFMPKVIADASQVKKVGFGQKLFKNEMDYTPQSSEEFIRVVDEADELLAIIYLPDKSETYNYSCVFSG